MHEVGLMSNILDTLRASASENQITRIKEIHLIVGKFSAVLPDSLQFAFEALRTDDQLFENAELVIEEKELECLCNDCKQTFTLEKHYDFTCPHCSGSNVQITAGREFSIAFYEGD